MSKLVTSLPGMVPDVQNRALKNESWIQILDTTLNTAEWSYERDWRLNKSQNLCIQHFIYENISVAIAR